MAVTLTCDCAVVWNEPTMALTNGLLSLVYSVLAVVGGRVALEGDVSPQQPPMD